MNIGGLDPTLRDLATALGIANSGGDLQTDWFANPLSSLETVLSDDDQRAALLDLLDREVPAATLSDIPAGEQWHPLLPDNDRGNLYLTMTPDGAGVRVGLGARFGTAGAAPLQASLLLTLPCVELADNATSFIAGTATAPLSIALRVEANLTRAADGIGLHAASGAAVLAPRAVPSLERFAVTLEGLDLDGTGARNLDLQPDLLDQHTLSLVIGLIVARLRAFAGGGDAAGAIADNLPALLGLADAIPPFPFAAAGSPGAVRAWLDGLLADPAAVLRWFGHLSALLGGAPAVSGTGTADDPWRVAVLAQANAPRLELTLASVAGGDGTTQLQFGMALTVGPNAGTPAAIEGQAVLFAVPIRGT
jgi:hypothetical protein